MLGVMYRIYNSLEASNEDLLKEILLALDKMIRVCNLKTTYDTDRIMVNDILQEAKRNNSIIHTIEYERIIEEIADLLHGGEEFEFFSNEEISFEPNYLKKAVDMIKNWGNSKDEFSNDFETQLTRWAQLFREKIAHSIERSDLSSEVIKFLGKKGWIFGDDYIYVLDAICMGLTQN